MSNFQDQSEFRKKISDIRNNESLSQEEKNKQINDLFVLQNKKFLKKDNTKKECEHYPYKKCGNFKFSCCNSRAECIRCHNENDLYNLHPVILDLITCNNCSLEQAPSEKCINLECNIKFSKNYCTICNIWSEKDMYHCKDCGICRIGKEDSSFHCHNCKSCFQTKDHSIHKCVSIPYNDQVCGYCLKNIYNSQHKSFPLICNHVVHQSCYKNAIESDQYKCPLCKKTVCNVDWNHIKFLISIQPMPEEDIISGDIVEVNSIKNVLFRVIDVLDNNMLKGELFEIETNNKIDVILKNKILNKKNKKVEIYCNDCCKRSYTTFHYLGNECMKCNSFNTNL